MPPWSLLAWAKASYHVWRSSVNLFPTIVVSTARCIYSLKLSEKSFAELPISMRVSTKLSKTLSNVVCVSCSLIWFWISSILSSPSIMPFKYSCTSPSIFAQKAGASDLSFSNCSTVRSNSPVILPVPINSLAALTDMSSASAMSCQSLDEVFFAIRLPMEWEPADAPELRRSFPSRRYASICFSTRPSASSPTLSTSMP